MKFGIDIVLFGLILIAILRNRNILRNLSLLQTSKYSQPNYNNFTPISFQNPYSTYITNYCINCGTKFEGNQRFCIECGQERR